MDLGLKNKVIIVTGGSKGIGGGIKEFKKASKDDKKEDEKIEDKK